MLEKCHFTQFIAKWDKLLEFEDYYLLETVGSSPYYCYNDVVCSKYPKYVTFVVISNVKSLRKVSFYAFYGKIGQIIQI